MISKKQFLLTRTLTSAFKRIAVIVICLFLIHCTPTSPVIDERKSTNYQQRIKFLVIHNTVKNYQDSVQALSNKGEMSTHYLVPESHDHTYLEDDLTILKLVNEKEQAWHANNSYWQNRKNINAESIGVHLVNIPQCEPRSINNSAMLNQHSSDDNLMCFYPDYDPKQITLLIELLKTILRKNPDILPVNILGHSDISAQNIIEPGPRFPWYQLYQEGIGAWYDIETVKNFLHLFEQKSPKISLVQRALSTYGYFIAETGQFDEQTQAGIYAFQNHFLPWNTSGQIDNQSVATLFALLQKYMPEQAQQLLAQYNKQPDVQRNQHSSTKNGQIDNDFPQTSRSDRELVNDRAVFKSYQGRGQIIIDNKDAVSADIFINGEKLNIASPLQPYNSYQYRLNKRTHDGNNTFKVENVLPEGSSLHVNIPYPTLENKTAQQTRLFNKVDELINEDVKQGFPGAVLVVVKNGSIVKNTAYGYKRKFSDGGELLPTPVDMSTDTLFDIASNTKMFATNFALMKLVTDGKLDVSKPINHYLPKYKGEGRDTRTVKDIMTHHAGYSPQVKFFTKNNHLGAHFFSQDAKNTKELILTKVPFAAGLKSKRVYSDTDYMLLGMIVEKISGMALDKFVEYTIYQPLGLNNTVFNPLQKGFRKNQSAATEIHGTTREHRVNFENVRTYVLQGEVHDEKAFHSFDGIAGHAGLFSTGEDLAVLSQLLLNRGGYGNKRLFSEKVIDQFIKPDDGNGTYGLGWRRANNGDRKWHFGPYASKSAYGHTGWTGTVTVIDPEHDLAIILLTNARHSEIEGDDKHYQFKGKTFETGKYGSVISLVYEAILEQ